MKRNSDWIDVNEKLPNQHLLVLVYTESEIKCCAHLCYTKNKSRNHNIFLTMIGGGGDRFLYDVTHWQYLPTDPKKK